MEKIENFGHFEQQTKAHDLIKQLETICNLWDTIAKEGQSEDINEEETRAKEKALLTEILKTEFDASVLSASEMAIVDRYLIVGDWPDMQREIAKKLDIDLDNSRHGVGAVSQVLNEIEEDDEDINKE